jgi:hypothetical protein
VLTTLALLAWIVPGRAGAAPGGGNTFAAFGNHPEPQATVYPVEFRQAVRAHRQRTETLTVTNTGEALLIFAATACTSGIPTEDDLLGPGEPDGFGYVWHDSNEPGGPEFDWVEISQIGTKLPLSRDGSEVVDLPFVFPFYREAKTSIQISSHGYMTFGTKGDAWSNKPIPTEDEPNDLIAVYWEDLNPPKAPPDGGVFYYHDAANNRFIVEWNKVPRSYETGQYTFQAILYPDGRIVCQYLDMTFGSYYYSTKGTIGIENATGTDGVEVIYDTLGCVQAFRSRGHTMHTIHSCHPFWDIWFRPSSISALFLLPTYSGSSWAFSATMTTCTPAQHNRVQSTSSSKISGKQG